ncbi:MAG: FG-GAP-like repeat-containing protein [Cyclobacteriaceae bacterium]
MKRHFLIALLGCQIAWAQTDQAQIIQASFQQINSGQVEKAINNLSELVSDHPDNGQAWTMLGLAYRNKQDYHLSLTAYRRAQELQAGNAPAMFNLGIAYALADNPDAAFDWLMKVKASNAFNITNIGLSAAAPILSKDERYQRLFPTAEEFAKPFVENGVEIIHDWAGEKPNDQFGWIARNIGDVDGDGVFDVTASSPTNSDNANAGGKVYVYSGKSGNPLWSFAAEEANGQLGMSVESAGDVNNDGIPDVVASAPYANKVYVFSGNTGKIIHTWKGENPNGGFGRGVKGVGDVNKDGFGDVLIGEPFQIWGAPIAGGQVTSPGNAYLYSGKDGSLLKQWKGKTIGDGFGTAVAGKTSKGNSLLMIGSPSSGFNNGGQVFVYKGTDTNPFFVMEADSTGNSLGGMFLSVVGDVDGDQTPDLYASDWSNGALGRATGRVYVYSGATGKPLITLTGESQGDGFGIGIADAGDINKDGFDDLVIGAWQHASAAPSGGKVYVYSGKDSKLLRTVTCKVVGETFGFDATGIGDVNGDDIPDLLLTSAWSAIKGVRSGRALVISGRVK